MALTKSGTIAGGLGSGRVFVPSETSVAVGSSGPAPVKKTIVSQRTVQVNGRNILERTWSDGTKDALDQGAIGADEPQVNTASGNTSSDLKLKQAAPNSGSLSSGNNFFSATPTPTPPLENLGGVSSRNIDPSGNQVTLGTTAGRTFTFTKDELQAIQASGQFSDVEFRDGGLTPVFSGGNGGSRLAAFEAFIKPQRAAAAQAAETVAAQAANGVAAPVTPEADRGGATPGTGPLGGPPPPPATVDNGNVPFLAQAQIDAQRAAGTPDDLQQLVATFQSIFTTAGLEGQNRSDLFNEFQAGYTGPAAASGPAIEAFLTSKGSQAFPVTGGEGLDGTVRPGIGGSAPSDGLPNTQFKVLTATDLQLTPDLTTGRIPMLEPSQYPAENQAAIKSFNDQAARQNTALALQAREAGSVGGPAPGKTAAQLSLERAQTEAQQSGTSGQVPASDEAPRISGILDFLRGNGGSLSPPGQSILNFSDLRLPNGLSYSALSPAGQAEIRDWMLSEEATKLRIAARAKRESSPGAVPGSDNAGGQPKPPAILTNDVAVMQRLGTLLKDFGFDANGQAFLTEFRNEVFDGNMETLDTQLNAFFAKKTKLGEAKVERERVAGFFNGELDRLNLTGEDQADLFAMFADFYDGDPTTIDAQITEFLQAKRAVLDRQVKLDGFKKQLLGDPNFPLNFDSIYQNDPALGRLLLEFLSSEEFNAAAAEAGLSGSGNTQPGDAGTQVSPTQGANTPPGQALPPGDQGANTPPGQAPPPPLDSVTPPPIQGANTPPDQEPPPLLLDQGTGGPPPGTSGGTPLAPGDGSTAPPTAADQTFVDELRTELRGVLSSFGFNDEQYRDTQEGAIKDKFQQARERLGRQFGISPGGSTTGKAQRQFELLAGQQIQELAALDRDIQDRVEKVRAEQLTAFTQVFQTIAGTDLDQQRINQTGAQFNKTLELQLSQLGLNEIQVQAAVKKINSDIANSTRATSAQIGQDWAALMGQSGTESGTVTAEDLGVTLTSADKMSAFLPTAGDSATRTILSQSFAAMMGRSPSEQELNKLQSGTSVGVDSMPTLESRKLAAEVTQQNMERVAKYDSIADSLQLDRDKFTEVQEASDRQWNVATGDVASQFGLDQNAFNNARFQLDNLNNTVFFDDSLSPTEKVQKTQDNLNLIATKFFPGAQLDKFKQASAFFDRVIGGQQAATARSLGIDAETWATAQRQSAQAEERFLAVWGSLTGSQTVAREQLSSKFSASPLVTQTVTDVLNRLVPLMGNAAGQRLTTRDGSFTKADEENALIALFNGDNVQVLDTVRARLERAFPGKLFPDAQLRETLGSMMGSWNDNRDFDNLSFLPSDWFSNLSSAEQTSLMSLLGGTAGGSAERKSSSLLGSLGRLAGIAGGALIGGALSGGNPAAIAAGAQAGSQL